MPNAHTRTTSGQDHRGDLHYFPPSCKQVINEASDEARKMQTGSGNQLPTVSDHGTRKQKRKQVRRANTPSLGLTAPPYWRAQSSADPRMHLAIDWGSLQITRIVVKWAYLQHLFFNLIM